MGRWLRWGPACALVTMLAVPLLSSCDVALAASTFANPAFQQRWQRGEAVAPNFWGPLATAKDGQQEAYKEAAGGTRLVQYFDKGRMELTNGAVTNGLLATELVRGQIQTGDATFQPQAPPQIAMAGDPDNTVPTYAQLTGVGAPLLAPSAAKRGQAVTAAISDREQLIAIPGEDPFASSAAVIAGYDAPTQHNVPGAFVDYREQAGLSAIGYAISEPFYALVAVGGAPKNVLLQVFERRVLTYTSTNPIAFRVEMGNIGQHYFRWRYPTGLPLTVPTPPTASAGEDPTQAAQRLFPGYTVKDVTVLDLGADGGQQATVRLERGQGLERNEIAAVLVLRGGAWSLAYRTAADANAVVEIAGYPKTAAHPGYTTLMYHLCGANCNAGEHTVLRYDGNGAFTVVLTGMDDRGTLRGDAQSARVTLTGPVYRVQDPRCCPSYTFARTWQWQGGTLAPQDFAYQSLPDDAARVPPPWLKSATFMTVAVQPFLQAQPDAAALAPLFASNVAITDPNGQRCTASRAEVGAAVAKIAAPYLALWQAANGIDFTAALNVRTSGGTPASASAGSCTLGGSGVGGYVLTVTVTQSGFLITEIQAVAQPFKAIPEGAIQVPGV